MRCYSGLDCESGLCSLYTLGCIVKSWAEHITYSGAVSSLNCILVCLVVYVTPVLVQRNQKFNSVAVKGWKVQDMQHFCENKDLRCWCVTFSLGFNFAQLEDHTWVGFLYGTVLLWRKEQYLSSSLCNLEIVSLCLVATNR